MQRNQMLMGIGAILFTVLALSIFQKFRSLENDALTSARRHNQQVFDRGQNEIWFFHNQKPPDYDSMTMAERENWDKEFAPQVQPLLDLWDRPRHEYPNGGRPTGPATTIIR